MDGRSKDSGDRHRAGELIEDYVLTEVLRERLEEEVEPWEDVEGDGWGDLT